MDGLAGPGGAAGAWVPGDLWQWLPGPAGALQTATAAGDGAGPGRPRRSAVGGRAAQTAARGRRPGGDRRDPVPTDGGWGGGHSGPRESRPEPIKSRHRPATPAGYGPWVKSRRP